MPELRIIGRVESSLTDAGAAPKQGDEGAPSAWLRFDADLAPAVDGLRPGDRIVVVTWLHEADRDVLRVHPRGDRANPETGVFATRSPHRPNPVGLHPATVTEVQPAAIRVDGLEAIDGTPVIDVKIAL